MSWLTVAILCLVVASCASTVLLVGAALVRPRIGALTDRAVIAVVISAFGLVSLVLTLNTDTGSAFLAVDAARAVFRLSVIALLFVPVLWDVLFLTGRLGGDVVQLIQTERDRISEGIAGLGLSPSQLADVRAVVGGRR